MSIAKIPSNGPLTLITSHLSLHDARAFGLTCKAQNQHFNSIHFWKDRYITIFWKDPQKVFPEIDVKTIKAMILGVLNQKKTVERKLEQIHDLLPLHWRVFHPHFLPEMYYVSRPDGRLFSEISLLPPSFLQTMPYLPQLAVFHQAKGLFDRVVRTCQRFDPECLIAAHVAVESDNLPYLNKLIPLIAGRRSTVLHGMSLLKRAVVRIRLHPGLDLEIVKFLAASLPLEQPVDELVDEKNTCDILGLLEEQSPPKLSSESFIPFKARRLIREKKAQLHEKVVELSKLNQMDPKLRQLVTEEDEAYAEMLKNNDDPRAAEAYEEKKLAKNRFLEWEKTYGRELENGILSLNQQIKALYPTEQSEKDNLI